MSRKPSAEAGEDRARVERFLLRHALSLKEAVEADVEPYRGLSLEASWRDVEAVCRDAAFMIAALPDRNEVVQQRDPPHPSFRKIMDRLIAIRGRGKT